MVELGWTGIIIPEDFGGLGFGYTGMGVVLEDRGRTLTACSCDRMPRTSCIIEGGSDDQKASLLPQVASGELLLALALEEGAHHNPLGVTATAEVSGSTAKVTGSKKFVLDGHVANKLIVAARSAGAAGDSDGVTLVLIDRDAAGVSVTRTIMADSRNAANIELNGAEGEVLGAAGEGGAVLERALDVGRILSAEMLGGVQECFERTVEYLKVREQFGVPIGSFQALKHRAAQMFCEVELSKSVVWSLLLTSSLTRLQSLRA